MTPRAGVKVIAAPQGALGAGPVIPFPSTENERTRVAREAARVAQLLAKPSPAQVALFRHLAGGSPDGYVVSAARWIETILKATKDLSEDEVRDLQGFDWTERDAAPEEVRRELLAALKAKRHGRR